MTRLSLTPGMFLAWYSSWNVTVVRTHQRIAEMVVSCGK